MDMNPFKKGTHILTITALKLFFVVHIAIVNLKLYRVNIIVQ